MIAYTATEQVHQQMPGRSHPHTRLVGIRIRSSTLPRTIAFTATEQVHQQKPGRSHPHNSLLEYRSGEKWEAVATQPGARGYPDRTQSPPKAISKSTCDR